MRRKPEKQASGLLYCHGRAFHMALEVARSQLSGSPASLRSSVSKFRRWTEIESEDKKVDLDTLSGSSDFRELEQ
jgi:hypothetical protein